MIASAILRMVRDANELVKADALDEGLTVEAQKLQVQRELLAAQQQALEKDETAPNFGCHFLFGVTCERKSVLNRFRMLLLRKGSYKSKCARAPRWLALQKPLLFAYPLRRAGSRWFGASPPGRRMAEPARQGGSQGRGV